MNRYKYLHDYVHQPFVQLVNRGEIWADEDGREFEVAFVIPETEPNHEMAEVNFTGRGGDIFLCDMIKFWRRVS